MVITKHRGRKSEPSKTKKAILARSHDLGMSFNSTGTCNQQARDHGKGIRHAMKRTQSFLFYVWKHVCHENKETCRKETRLASGSNDNELSGALVYNSSTLWLCSAATEAISSSSLRLADRGIDDLGLVHRWFCMYAEQCMINYVISA